MPGTGYQPVSLKWDVFFVGHWTSQYNNNNLPPVVNTHRFRGLRSMADGRRCTRQLIAWMNDCERSLQTRHRLQNSIPAQIMMGMSFLTFIGSLLTGNIPFAAYVAGLVVVAYRAAAAVGVAAAAIPAVPLAQPTVCYVQEMLL